MMDMDSMPYAQGGSMSHAPCSICGRNFNPDVLPRHEQACAKISQRRKVFDSTKQRHRGTELEHFLSTHKPSAPKVLKKNKRGWREKHEEFVQSLRAARTVSIAVKDGRPPPHVPSAPNPDYVLCPYCQRRFEENSAERHIPFCKEKASRISANTPGGRAAKGLQKRLSYKPPTSKKQSSQVNRDSPSAFSTPPGASVVMRNRNFSQTYTVSPDHSPASSNTPSSKKTRSKVPVPVIRNPTVPKRLPRPQQYNADAYSPSTQDKEELGFSDDSTLSPDKKTAFSKLHSPTSDRSTTVQSSTSPSHARRNRPSSSSRNLRNSVSSRRLLAALEYSETSSFDNEERVQQQVSSNDHTNTGAGKEGRRRRATYDRQPAAEQDSHTDPNGSQRTSTRRPQLPPAQGRRIEDIPVVYHHDDGLGTSRGAKPLKGIHELNQYGMPKSKYCYECGFKFPVPQAKYCCECGTKRI